MGSITLGAGKYSGGHARQDRHERQRHTTHRAGSLFVRVGGTCSSTWLCSSNAARASWSCVCGVFNVHRSKTVGLPGRICCPDCRRNFNGLWCAWVGVCVWAYVREHARVCVWDIVHGPIVGAFTPHEPLAALPSALQLGLAHWVCLHLCGSISGSRLQDKAHSRARAHAHKEIHSHT